MKQILLLLFTFLSLIGNAQHQKINFLLKADINKYEGKDKVFSIITRGNVKEIKKEVTRLGGQVGMSSGNIVQVKLLSHLIPEFSEKTFVQSIEYGGQLKKILNDTTLINSNVLPVHNGNSPLLTSYTGKGVLFGLIDTGIDLDHDDFKDTLGNTRILKVWDQRNLDNGTSPFGYGSIIDSSAINSNSANHKDDFVFKGHGTHVAGIGVGNGLAVNNYKGVAPEANIVVVAVDLESTQNTILDAVSYIYGVADSLGMPCVLNVSLGNYAGSHDGTDGIAVLMDSLINFKSGRAFVCAAGNAGAQAFHLQHQVNSDTTFTWFKYNSSSSLGYGAVFYEVWADTADLNQVNFSIGANLPNGNYNLRGNTPFDNIQSRIGTVTDTINNNGNIIGIVDTYGELQGDKYLLQVHIQEPDSNTYYFSLMTTGSGKLDVWSHPNLIGSSSIVKTGLPSLSVYPDIVHYQEPDTAQTIVSSFTCLPSVIAVGSYVNRKTYIDVNGTTQVAPNTPGLIDLGSSLGPNRRGFVKPDITAPGRIVLSTTSDTVAQFFMNNGSSHLVASGGKHSLKNGTSMAAPAVAGTVALYLEKCPNASMIEIKNSIISSANQDASTGVVPNTSYGYGKLNSFAALNTSNYNFSLGPNVNLCGDDSIQLTAPISLNYNWSTSANTQSIIVDTTAEVHLLVTNGSGCIGVSDTISIVNLSLPSKPTITVVSNDTLLHSSILDIQWYFNNSILNGATDSIYIAQNNGDYFLQVTDSFGCANNSDTISIIVLGITTNTTSNFAFYPNPTNGRLTIKSVDNEKIETINVINLLGEVVLSKKVNGLSNNQTLYLQGLAGGTYYIQINSEKSNRLQKIVLLR